MIPVAGPSITAREVESVSKAAAEAWYDKAGYYPAQFEERFAAYVGVPYALALPSCTSALHLALLACGIGKGDEVIVPDITWIATAAPITYTGAVPVFADIDPETWCLSPESFDANITPRTRAVIPVDLYGHVYDAERIRRIAGKHGIRVIEDAAEAIGSQYYEKKAGALGEAAAFSFHGTKTLTTGEGGMLVTHNRDIFERARFLSDHGRDPGDKSFLNLEVAYKYRMSSLQAALGLAQLERIDELVARKREIFGWYQEDLQGMKGLTLNREASGTVNTYWMVTVILDSGRNLMKMELMEKLRGRGIGSRPFFHPLSSLPAFAESPHSKNASQRNTNAYALSPFGLNLPSALSLTREDVHYVCSALKEILS